MASERPLRTTELEVEMLLGEMNAAVKKSRTGKDIAPAFAILVRVLDDRDARIDAAREEGRRTGLAEARGDGALLALLEAGRAGSARAFRSAMHAAGYGTVSSASRAAEYAKTAHDSVDLALVHLGQPGVRDLEERMTADRDCALAASTPDKEGT